MFKPLLSPSLSCFGPFPPLLAQLDLLASPGLLLPAAQFVAHLLGRPSQLPLSPTSCLSLPSSLRAPPYLLLVCDAPNLAARRACPPLAALGPPAPLRRESPPWSLPPPPGRACTHAARCAPACRLASCPVLPCCGPRSLPPGNKSQVVQPPRCPLPPPCS